MTAHSQSHKQMQELWIKYRNMQPSQAIPVLKTVEKLSAMQKQFAEFLQEYLPKLQRKVKEISEEGQKQIIIAQETSKKIKINFDEQLKILQNVLHKFKKCHNKKKAKNPKEKQVKPQIDSVLKSKIRQELSSLEASTKKRSSKRHSQHLDYYMCFICWDKMPSQTRNHILHCIFTEPKDFTQHMEGVHGYSANQSFFPLPKDPGTSIISTSHFRVLGNLIPYTRTLPVNAQLLYRFLTPKPLYPCICTTREEVSDRYFCCAYESMKQLRAHWFRNKTCLQDPFRIEWPDQSAVQERLKIAFNLFLRLLNFRNCYRILYNKNKLFRIKDENMQLELTARLPADVKWSLVNTLTMDYCLICHMGFTSKKAYVIHQQENHKNPKYENFRVKADFFGDPTLKFYNAEKVEVIALEKEKLQMEKKAFQDILGCGFCGQAFYGEDKHSRYLNHINSYGKWSQNHTHDLRMCQISD